MLKLFRSLFIGSKLMSITASRRPKLESLEDRTVLTTLDLTTAGASASANGALFQQVSAQPTGTGVINSFVRLHAGGNGAVAQGYNTDARSLQYDENKSPVFTRSLKLAEVPIVVVGGIAYREFLLDINQKASSPRLSLDELRIYLGGSGSLKGYDPGTKTLAGLSAAYDLDASGDNVVMLNARLNSGSGSGDMTLLVPDAVLTAAGGDYLYLYSKFGTTVSTNGGFEEWAVRSGGTPLGSVSGTVYFDNNISGTFDATDAGIFNVLVTLTDANGEVIGQQWTDHSGFYIFSGLEASQYTITVTTPDTYQPLAGSDSTTTVFVTSGEIDRHNDFGFILGDSGPPIT